MGRAPVFLQRKSYRRRRMMDVVRLLPLMGLVLWMVPLIWPLATHSDAAVAEGVTTSEALRYLFGVWIGVVLIAWLLSRLTRITAPEHEPGSEDVSG